MFKVKFSDKESYLIKKDPNLEIKDADIYDYFEETTWEDAIERASSGLLNLKEAIYFTTD